MSEEAPFRIVLAAEGPTDLRRISLLRTAACKL